jgi:hypothetical protein
LEGKISQKKFKIFMAFLDQRIAQGGVRKKYRSLKGFEV